MKMLIGRKSIIVVSIAVLIAVSTIVSINAFGSSGPVTGVLNTISRPLRELVLMVTGTFENIYSSIERYDKLVEDYERILQRNAELEESNRESINILNENKYLRESQGFAERHGGYEHVNASVVGRSGSNWSSSFTINIGSLNSSIERGNAVVTEYGMLIGQVSEVGPTSSVVITVLDTTFSAGAYIGEGNVPATLKGDYTLMRDGLLMLDHLDPELIIRPGDSVVTSGTGSVFPINLVVGEVVEVLRHDTGIGRYATVRPMRDVMTASHVFVITGFEVDEGVGIGVGAIVEGEG